MNENKTTERHERDCLDKMKAELNAAESLTTQAGREKYADALGNAMREKYWSELSIEERIERTREIVQRTRREMGEQLAMIESVLGENQRLSQRFLAHSHGADKVLIPAADERQYLAGMVGRGYAGSLNKCGPERPADPDKVYF